MTNAQYHPPDGSEKTCLQGSHLEFATGNAVRDNYRSMRSPGNGWVRRLAMRNLVVCSDGTWSTPEDTEGGLPAPTNVVKLYNAVAELGVSTPQKKYYHPGVGTEGSKLDRLVGGGMGKGLDDNIKSAYKWLATKYRANDHIFLFGFSRGAYTVRSLGGMISCCGLLDLSDPDLAPRDLWERVNRAFECYRDPDHDLGALSGWPFHNADGVGTAPNSTQMHFIGVWDTVGALGVPDDLAFLNLIDDPTEHEFHDTELGSTVSIARHALAIDEMRASFQPTLWTKWDADKTDVKQIWFPGVHGDVGGGYLERGLSDAALLWMMEEAESAGLELRPGVKEQVTPNKGGYRHDSLTGIFSALKTAPRRVPRMREDGAVFHPFASTRHANPPLYEDVYWLTKSLAVGESLAVNVYARQHWNVTGIFLEKGAEYLFEAKGEWLDKSIACGPDGADEGHFQLGEVFHIAGSLLGKAEQLVQSMTKNTEADFWYTKRLEDESWFALIGMIANGAIESPKPHVRLNEVFRIGSGRTWTPAGDGYLYCFANDAWHTYDNNKGSVRLTVTRLQV
jgi:uncharacterized protein (DUF2235 family)